MTYATRRPVVGVPGSLIVPNGSGLAPVLLGAQNTAAGTANQGYYIPFMAPYDTAVATMSFYCAAGTNNHDLGIYDASGNRLTSRGSTATTAGAVNTWTLGTPQPVTAGTLYYAAWSTAGTSTHAMTNTGGNNLRATVLGVWTQAIGAVTLPNPATFAAPGTLNVPYIRLTFTT